MPDLITGKGPPTAADPRGGGAIAAGVDDRAGLLKLAPIDETVLAGLVERMLAVDALDSSL